MTEDSSKFEKRALEGFTRITNKGIGSVILTQGDHDEVTVEADAEFRPQIRTEVRDGTLFISYDFEWQDMLGLRFIGRGPIRFHVTMKIIDGISLSGAGNVDAKAITTEKLNLALSGAGSIHIDSLTSASLATTLSGAGSITVAGKLTDLQIQLSGAGSFHGDKLETESAKITISGAGSAKLKVTKTLDATISGVGSVDYLGEPQVTQHVSGVGSLKKVV